MVKRRSPHVNNILNKVETHLRNAKKPLSLNEIQIGIHQTLTDREDLINIIRDNPKFDYDEMTDRYSLRKMYSEITSKESLLEFLKKEPKGIPENKDLLDCYRGIDIDIQTLSEEKYILKLFNADRDKKLYVLFYNNPHDTAHSRLRPVNPFVKQKWQEIRNVESHERKKIIEAYKKRL